jgi:hypothetical protein
MHISYAGIHINLQKGQIKDTNIDIKQKSMYMCPGSMKKKQGNIHAIFINILKIQTTIHKIGLTMKKNR